MHEHLYFNPDFPFQMSSVQQYNIYETNIKLSFMISYKCIYSEVHKNLISLKIKIKENI